MLRNILLRLFVLSLLIETSNLYSQVDPYNPLLFSAERKVSILDVTVKDADRDREIPIRIFICDQHGPAPVVLFSHGLGGSREGSAYLGNHWAARGYVAVFLQHHGSDAAVWQNVPLQKRMKAMEDAASMKNLLLRVKDVPAVLDELERWNSAEGHRLFGRMNMKRIGMSGHSFGALTTQAVSGQGTLLGIVSYTDQRIKASVIMSPSSPRQGSAKRAFSDVAIPWLLMTGTKDFGLIGGGNPESRMAVFPALPPGNKYELVLDNAEHSAFTDRALPGDTEQRNPNHHRAILAISTAFWDAWLLKSAAARSWLDGDGPRSVLEKGDRWQRK